MSVVGCPEAERAEIPHLNTRPQVWFRMWLLTPGPPNG
jgi:hypothetical protein